MRKIIIFIFLSMCLSLGAQEEVELQVEPEQQAELELQADAEPQEGIETEEDFELQESIDQDEDFELQEGIEAEEDPELQENAEFYEDAEQNSESETTMDLDSLFNNTSIVVFEEPEEAQDKGPINLRDKITVEVNYGFYFGLSPGWSETPWSDSEPEYSYVQGLKMDARLNLDIPLTENLRVHNSFYLAVPETEFFSIKEFYFEYDFSEKAYLQAGLYETAWGISRLYPFTNLPVRTPPSSVLNADPKKRITPGNAYITRLVIPIGIGGLELLGMTRHGYMEDASSPAAEDMSFGMKYNLALDGVDIDAGFLYHQIWPVRSFLSVKTTLGDTEVYAEGLLAAYRDDDRTIYASGNFGFVHEFFDRKLTLNGEVFYNGETDATYWKPKTALMEGSVGNFFEGLNGAMAFVFRPGVLGMRIFARAMGTYKEKSVYLIPGISIKPGDLTISLSAPMALGKRSDDGSNYYSKNDDKRSRPFSIMLGVSFSGRLRYTL